MNEIIELVLNNTDLNLNTLCILCGGLASVPVSIATVSVKAYFGNKKQTKQEVVINNNISLPPSQTDPNQLMQTWMSQLTTQIDNETKEEYQPQ